MGQEEMLRIRDLDPLLPELAPRVFALFAEPGRDRWTPEGHIAEFEALVPGRSERTTENSPHDFCCWPDHSEHIAKHTHRLLQKLLST
jgi:hypothetical protein